MKIGTNLLNSQQVAIKFEPRKSDAPQLRDEYRTYKILSGTCMYFNVISCLKKRDSNTYIAPFFFVCVCTPCCFLLFCSATDGIPSAYYFGQEGLHNILVIDLLGPSLEDLFDSCSRKFSIKTVATLARHMVKEIT